MHFLIRIKNPEKVVIKHLTSGKEICEENSIGLPQAANLISVETVSSENGNIYIIGDPVYHENKEEALRTLSSVKGIEDFVKKTDGFYYLLFWNQEKKELRVTSSMFAILPLFYSFNSDALVVSSSFDKVFSNTSAPLKTDESYHLEKLIFNYPFLNRTPIEQIKTVNPNEVLVFSEGKIKFVRHTDISDYFVTKPESLNQSKNKLVKTFIESIKGFFPEKKSCITLTGGLDGRTIVSAALHAKKEFFTYSYGGADDNDIRIPKNISGITGIPHKTLIIDETFVKSNFWEHGKEFNRRSFGLGNISRAHYSYAAKNIFQGTDYLISGNFGSEIMRSMKAPGVMTSEMLFFIFQNPDKKTLVDKVKNYSSVKYFNKELLNGLAEKLSDTIISYLDSLPKGLSDNQKFYIYLFEQVFPKYFGPEIMSQREFVRHRAPFLSFRFITELLKTKGAGANSAFMETNPIKRYGGQSLYGYIMQQCDRRLLHIDLDKGYKPAYFIQATGKLKILFKYYLKKFKKPSVTGKVHYQILVREEAIKKCKEENIENKFYNISKILSDYEAGVKNDDVHLFNIISASLYLKSIEPGLKK